ncbi:MAG TPA: universal stress protein [Luteimonas sp.]
MNTTLINAEGRVLAAIDPSSYAEGVAALAAWAASRLGVPLELMHAIDRDAGGGKRDLSGMLALGTQEVLLAELTALDEERARVTQAHGRAMLERLQAGLAGQPGAVQVTLGQRHGELVQTLLDIEDDVRLFVIGKRGEHASVVTAHLGSNLERVVRAVRRPVLVASRRMRPIRRFMIAFDDSATTRKCVEMVALSPLLGGLECHLIAVGGKGGGAGLEWARARLAEAGFEPRIHALPGDPEEVIAHQVEALGIDLLVMGAYGHSRIRALIVGSTTTQLLRACEIPMLLLR